MRFHPSLLTSRAKSPKITAMHRSLLKVMCVVLLLCGAWVVVAPEVDIAPTAFRFAVFAALTLFLLRCAFKYARPSLVWTATRLLESSLGESVSGHSGSRATLIPLRC